MLTGLPPVIKFPPLLFRPWKSHLLHVRGLSIYLASTVATKRWGTIKGGACNATQYSIPSQGTHRWSKEDTSAKCWSVSVLSVEFRSVWCRLSKMKRCRHYLAPIAGCQYLVVAWQLVPIISWQSTRDIKVGVISKRIFLVQGTLSSFQPRWGQSSQFIQS